MKGSNKQTEVAMSYEKVPRSKIKMKNTTLLTLVHSERPKLYTILAFLSALGLNMFYKTVIPWKQGLHQRTENFQVYKFSGPD